MMFFFFKFKTRFNFCFLGRIRTIVVGVLCVYGMINLSRSLPTNDLSNYFITEYRYVYNVFVLMMLAGVRQYK